MVEAGVGDEPRGAEHIGLQIAEAAPRVVFIDPHLVGELFGVEAPALGIDRVSGEAAEARDALGLLRQRDLVVMARRGLVIGERRQRPRRIFGGVAQVDVISAGARAVECGDLVIAAGRAILDIGGDAANLDLGLGQAAEGFGKARLNRLHLGVEFGDQLRLALVGVGIEEARVLAERAHPFGDRPLGHPLRLEDRVGARAEIRDAVEPELVHFLGRHARRRRIAERIGIIFVALGQAPHAGVVGRAGAGGAKLVGLTAHRGIDFALDDGGAAFRPVAGDVFRLGGEIFRQPVGVGGGGPDAVELAECAVDDEIGRDDVVRMVGLDPPRLVVHLHREIGAAREIGLGIGGVRDAVLVGEEVGDRAVGAAELRHRMRFRPAVKAVAERVVSLDIMFPRAAKGFVIDEVHARELGGVDRRQLLEPVAVEIVPLADARGRAVGELGFGGGAVALVGAERGRKFGVLVEQHVVDAFVYRRQPRAFAVGGRRKGGARGRTDAREHRRGRGGGKQGATVEHDGISEKLR